MLPRTATGIARPRRSAAEDIRNSAVMILLTEGATELDMVFTLRSTKLRSHSGQISFPGGRIDAGETPQEAALRETREEIGVPESRIEVFGNLSKIHVPPSNSDIHPFVGYTKEKPIIGSPDEVEEVFTAPFSYVTDPKNIKSMSRQFDGTDYEVPYIDVHPRVPLWGATAIILAELMEMVRGK